MDFDLERDVGVLERTPRVVRALLSGLGAEWTDAHYGEKTWSPRQIVAHYIDGDRTDWIPRARLILQPGEPRTFEPYDREGHRAYASCSVQELLDLFESGRAKCIAELRSLPIDAAALQRSGMHPALGPVTLGQLLCAWVVHDLHHIGHICKAMAHQHRDDAGAFQAYLSILNPPAPR